MSERTLADLKQKQALPLKVKVALTRERIRQWVHEFGEDGAYISFSGGKDSTVLLDIVRNVCGYTDLPAVFVDVPTQYPELKQFVLTFDNVTILKPQISFAKVCEQYGFPMISKEVSESVEGARKYLRKLLASMGEQQLLGGDNSITLANIEKSEKLASFLNERMVKRQGGNNQRLANMLGWRTKDNSQPIKANITQDERSNFALYKYKFFLEAPFEISNKCCNIMKKNPLHNYTRTTGRKPITGQMADESHLRTQKWIENGCNGFNLKIPTSNPMAFWTEQDVLQYIVENNLKICSVYGDVVEDFGDQLEGQMTLGDFGLYQEQKKLKCTGCSRTGCVLCGFGCHLGKKENRFEVLKETHPKFYALLDVFKNNGVTYREALEWTNEHMTGCGHIYM